MVVQAGVISMRPELEINTEYTRTDGIFSCDKCGDSGTIRNPDFVLRFGNGPNEKPQFIDCSCRDNPLSIHYLQSKAREKK
jgi:hypothetical protein